MRPLAALAFALVSLGCAAEPPAAPVPAEAPARRSPAEPTQQQVQSVIREQTARRSSAIGGIVLGAVVILGGIVVSAVQTVNEADDKAARGDTSDTSYNYGGTLAGLAIAAPILWISATTFADAQKQLRQARRQRRISVGYTPEPGRERLTLALAFGD